MLKGKSQKTDKIFRTMKILPIYVWDAIKVVLRERCIVLYAFVKKKKDSVCKHAGQDVRKRIVEKKKKPQRK